MFRPGWWDTLASPSAIVVVAASITAIISVLLPHSVDPSSGTPTTVLQWIVAEWNRPGIPLRWIVLWPYVFSMATLGAIISLVVARPRWYRYVLIGLPIAAAVLLSCGWVMLLFSGIHRSRLAMVIAVVVVPIASTVVVRMIWLVSQNRMESAAAWGFSMVSLLAVFSLRWFWFVQLDQLSVGGWVSIGSITMMMLGSWVWGVHARYDFYDRSARFAPFQYSLRQSLIAMTLFAVALTYWQLFQTLVRLP